MGPLGRAVLGRWRDGDFGCLAAALAPIVALLGAESLFLAWWSRQKPSNDRDWGPSMAVLPRAVIAGDAVTIENVRNLEYFSIDDFKPQFEARTYHLSNIKGVDVVFFDWGDGFRGHPALVFDERRLAVMVEVAGEDRRPTNLDHAHPPRDERRPTFQINDAHCHTQERLTDRA